jgi:transposase
MGPQWWPGSLTPSATARAPRRLTAEQLVRLPNLLCHGPESYGFRGRVWAGKRVAEVICVVYGMIYHAAHAGRWLRAICESPQKPR